MPKSSIKPGELLVPNPKSKFLGQCKEVTAEMFWGIQRIAAF